MSLLKWFLKVGKWVCPCICLTFYNKYKSRTVKRIFLKIALQLFFFGHRLFFLKDWYKVVNSIMCSFNTLFLAKKMEILFVNSQKVSNVFKTPTYFVVFIVFWKWFQRYLSSVLFLLILTIGYMLNLARSFKHYRMAQKPPNLDDARHSERSACPCYVEILNLWMYKNTRLSIKSSLRNTILN